MRKDEIDMLHGNLWIGMLAFAVPLMLTNILNNIKICTGGMEQNRLDTKQEEERTNNAYRFQQSPRKFYANGINGMLLINYQF